MQKYQAGGSAEHMYYLSDNNDKIVEATPLECEGPLHGTEVVSNPFWSLEGSGLIVVPFNILKLFYIIIYLFMAITKK